MKFKTWLYLAGGVVWAFLPLIAYAAEFALVPCGRGSDPTVYSALSCNLCSVGQLVQNVINFLVGIAIPISVLMFGYAGILMFTSGPNPSQVERGKKIFQSVFIGFILVITGWLVVQTILGVFVADSFNFATYWNGLRCEALQDIRNETTQGTVSTFIDSVLGNPPAQPLATTYTASCPTGWTYNDKQELCINPANPTQTSTPTTVQAGTGVVSRAELERRLAGTGVHLADLERICGQEGLNNCAFAQAVMANESGGRARCSQKSACGLMQVIPSTARWMDADGSLGVRDLNNDADVNALLNSNPQIGMTLGVRYLAYLEEKFNGNPQRMAAGYNGGEGAAANSTSCSSGYVYQCTSVRNRFGETRNYVPNVLNTLAIINGS